MEGVEARTFCQGTRKKGLDVSQYRRVFRGNKVVHCLALKALKLTAEEMLTRKPASGRVTRTDAGQQTAIAPFLRGMKY